MEWEKKARALNLDYDKQHEHKVGSITFRKHVLERQIKVNYENEFDRLKGHLYANPRLPAPTKEHIKKRMKHLQDIAKHGLSDIDKRPYLHRDDVDKYNV